MNNQKTLLSKKNVKEFLFVLLFYIFFAILYYSVLFWNKNEEGKLGIIDFLDIKDFWFSSAFVYFFNFIASIIIWYFGIFLFRKKTVTFKVVLVFILIPIVTYFFREIRYDIVDFYKSGRLSGTGTVWDWYIPSLFLMFQFGCYFAYNYFKETQEKLKLENQLR